MSHDVGVARKAAAKCFLRSIALAAVAFFPLVLHAQSVPDIVMAALQSLQSAYPRTSITVLRTGASNVQQTWQWVTPKRYRFVQVPTGLLPELVVWEEDAYLREGTGWYRKELNASPIAVGRPDWMQHVLENAMSQGVQMPDETIGIVAVRHYSAQVNYRDDVGLYSGRFEMWLSGSLPVRFTFDGRYAGTALAVDTNVDYGVSPALSIPAPVVNPR